MNAVTFWIVKQLLVTLPKMERVSQFICGQSVPAHCPSDLFSFKNGNECSQSSQCDNQVSVSKTVNKRKNLQMRQIACTLN